MSHDKRYRVVSGNCVLNYYFTKGEAVNYMQQLEKHSPDTFKEADIELRYLGPDEDPHQWYTISKLCY